jgi:tRNA(Ile)-lysidine synthase
MTLTLSALAQHLRDYPEVKHFRVALSGGMDSMVLLHCMAKLRNEGVDWQLSAVHVHHGLNHAADDWTRFCEDTCQILNIPCTVIHVDASPVPGESPEATARVLRYQAIAEVMQAGDALVSGHHQDDQAETLLLQLMRGCGPSGLAAMPKAAPFASGLLIRPFLLYSRQQLLDYATEHNLDWVEDSSNSDSRYDRNYMRHEILPLLIARWPGLVSSLCRTSSNMAEASFLLDELAMQDLQQVKTGQAGMLQVDGLLALNDVRLRNLLRFWIRDLNLAVPSQSQLQHIFSDVIHAGEDSNPCVTWSGVEIRRYRGKLYALAAMMTELPEKDISWDPSTPLTINGVGSLQLRPIQGMGLAPDLLAQSDLCIRFRQGGERIQPARRGHQHELKKLFQEAAIPPWERDRTPILYQGDSIVAVAGLCDSAAFHVGPEQKGLILEWDKCFN